MRLSTFDYRYWKNLKLVDYFKGNVPRGSNVKVADNNLLVIGKVYGVGALVEIPNCQTPAAS